MRPVPALDGIHDHGHILRKVSSIMSKNVYITLLLLFGAAGALFGQATVFSTDQVYTGDQKGIVYDKEFSIDFKIHTNGFGLGVNIGTLKTYYLTRFFNIEIGELKHPREYRQNFDFQLPGSNRISRAFIFGKQNSFFVLRGGIGEKRYFSEKAKRKGLAVGISYEGGPSLGIQKPYYLELIRFLDAGNEYVIRSERYAEENADRFLNIHNIYGSSGFAKGLNEINIQPGVHAKVALHFDWGAFDEFVKAMEAGIMIDGYLNRVPILVETDATDSAQNRQLFVNLFVNFQFGKRW